MKLYKDRCLDNKDLFRLVMIENYEQIKKWGIQESTSFEWLAYLTEELGELSEAISEHEYRQGTKNDVVKEAIQVATLALKIAEMYKKEG